MSRSFTFGIYWDSESKGNREKTGWHPRTEETMAGIVVGHFGVFAGFEATP